VHRSEDDAYSNSSFSKCIASLMHIYFYIYVHEVKHERTEQNVQYLIGQSIMTSNEWCIWLGKLTISTEQFLSQQILQNDNDRYNNKHNRMYVPPLVWTKCSYTSIFLHEIWISMNETWIISDIHITWRAKTCPFEGIRTYYWVEEIFIR
jgi:hypothetical protein